MQSDLWSPVSKDIKYTLVLQEGNKTGPVWLQMSHIQKVTLQFLRKGIYIELRLSEIETTLVYKE